MWYYWLLRRREADALLDLTKRFNTVISLDFILTLI